MINMELEFKRSALKQLKYYKKKNPIAYKIIREKLEEIINNPEDTNYKKVKKYPKYKRARKGNYRNILDVLKTAQKYTNSFSKSG